MQSTGRRVYQFFIAISSSMFVLLSCVSSALAEKSDFSTELEKYARSIESSTDALAHEKLGDIYRVRDDNSNALAQYLIAKGIVNSASIEVKIGQTYLAERNYCMAVQAFNGALVQSTDDPLVQEALVAGCEELLKRSPSQATALVGHTVFARVVGQVSDPQSVYREWVNSLADEQSKADEVDFKPFMADLGRRLKRAWFPPSGNSLRSTRAILVIAKSGLLRQVYLEEPTGEAFDRSVIKAVELADPYRPFPPLAKETKKFVATFDQSNGEITVRIDLYQPK